MYFGCSKERSHRDVFFEYPQHMFWMHDKANSLSISTLIWRPVNRLQSLLLSMKMYIVVTDVLMTLLVPAESAM